MEGKREEKKFECIRYYFPMVISMMIVIEYGIWIDRWMKIGKVNKVKGGKGKGIIRNELEYMSYKYSVIDEYSATGKAKGVELVSAQKELKI